MVLFIRLASLPEAYTPALTMVTALGVASIAQVLQATYPPAPAPDRRSRPNLAFVKWATIVLTALAIVSVALGVPPVEDPTTTILAAP